jgi:hypothetical protein
MALSQDASQLANLLGVLTQPDTEAIRQAEQALKPLLKDPRCVPALVEILKAKTSQVRPLPCLLVWLISLDSVEMNHIVNICSRSSLLIGWTLSNPSFVRIVLCN